MCLVTVSGLIHLQFQGETLLLCTGKFLKFQAWGAVSLESLVSIDCAGALQWSRVSGGVGFKVTLSDFYKSAK